MKEHLDSLETNDLQALAELCGARVANSADRPQLIDALRDCIGRDSEPPPPVLMDTRLVAIRSARTWTARLRETIETTIAAQAKSVKDEVSATRADCSTNSAGLQSLRTAVFGDPAVGVAGLQKDQASIKKDFEALERSSRMWERTIAAIGALCAFGGGAWVYHTYDKLKTAQDRLQELSTAQEVAIQKVRDEGSRASEQLNSAAEVHRKHVGSQVLSRCLLLASSASVSRDDSQLISRQLEEDRSALQGLKESALLGPEEKSVCDLSDRFYEALQRLIRLDTILKPDVKLAEVAMVAAQVHSIGTATATLARRGTYSDQLEKLETRRLNLLGILSLHRWYTAESQDDLTEAEKHFGNAVARDPEFWRARNNVAVAVIERYNATKQTLNDQDCRRILRTCEECIMAAMSRNPSPKYDSMLKNNLASIRMEGVKLLGRTRASAAEIEEAVKKARDMLGEARRAATVHEVVDLTEAELLCVERSVGARTDAEEAFEELVVEKVRSAGAKLGIRAQFKTAAAFLRSCDGFKLCGQKLLDRVLGALGYNP